MPNDFTQKIHDCAMESEDNLIVFVRAAQSFGEFHTKLISSFATKLEQKLKDEFPASDGWEIYERSLVTEPLKAYSALSIRSESWQPTLRVLVEASSICKVITYGVAWRPQHTDQKIKKYIFDTMNQKICKGFMSDQWPFYIQTRKNDFKFSDWSKEDAIISMRQVIKGEQSAEILDFFYNELVAIVEVLDNFVKG